MPEWLNQVDVALFYFFNVGLQNPVFDWLMPFITEKTHWFPVWGAAIVLMAWKGGRKGRTVVLLAIPIILISDQLTSSVLKPFFGRMRPCVALEGINLLVKKKTSFSMPSGHAANFTAAATLFTFYYRRHGWWLFGIALLVGYSRIAVGVHYPFDVLVGSLVGFTSAGLVLIIWRKLEQRIFSG